MPAEQKERVGNKEVHLVFLFNDGSQGIDSISHIGVTAYDVNTGEGTGIGILKHDAPP